MFLPAALVAKMARYGREMVEQLLANPQYQADSRAAIPAEFRAPNEDPVPLFVQADFGLDADLEPKLVEIQGFPTLYAYQPMMAAAYREAYGIDAVAGSAAGWLDAAMSINALLRRAIVAEPRSGKRRAARDRSVAAEDAPRFPAHRAACSACARWISRTCAKKAARSSTIATAAPIPIRRIYNRAIVDELVRRGIRMPSISATNWMWNGPDIRTGFSA